MKKLYQFDDMHYHTRRDIETCCTCSHLIWVQETRGDTKYFGEYMDCDLIKYDEDHRWGIDANGFCKYYNKADEYIERNRSEKICQNCIHITKLIDNDSDDQKYICLKELKQNSKSVYTLHPLQICKDFEPDSK